LFLFAGTINLRRHVIPLISTCCLLPTFLGLLIWPAARIS